MIAFAGHSDPEERRGLAHRVYLTDAAFLALRRLRSHLKIRGDEAVARALTFLALSRASRTKLETRREQREAREKRRETKRTLPVGATGASRRQARGLTHTVYISEATHETLWRLKLATGLSVPETISRALFALLTALGATSEQERDHE